MMEGGDGREEESDNIKDGRMVKAGTLIRCLEL
jgi:hypothetical protein